MSITRMRKDFAHILKPVLIVIALIFFVSIFFGYSSYITDNRQQQEEGREVLATVNGVPISRVEFYSVLQRQYETAKRSGGMSALQEAQLKTSLFQQFVSERLRISAAAQQDVKVSRRELADEKKKIVDEQIEQIRTSAAGERTKKLSDKELNLLLSRQNPPLTIEKLRKEIGKELTKDVVRQQLMVRKLEDGLKAKVGKIDDARLKDSYRMVTTRQIVIDVDPTPDPQAKRKAEEILKKAKAGEDFAKLARENSDDAYSKERGGELPPMPVMYDKDIQNLKAGEISGVLKAPQGGYRIVKVEKSELQLPPDFDKKKKDYRYQLKMNLENQQLMEFYLELDKKKKVEVHDPELKGYWLASQAQMAEAPAEREKLLAQSATALLKATRESPDMAAPYCKLAEIYAMQGNTDKAIGVFTDILDGRKITEGADLRLKLAELQIQKGEKAKAKPNLDLASEMAYDNAYIHYQLQSMYKTIGENELAAKEEQWIKEYSERMQAAQAPPPEPEKDEKPAPKKGG